MAKTVFDTRRERFRAVIEARGGPKIIAKKLGYSSTSYISQTTGKNPTRVINEKPARAIEQLLGLPAGYLDHEDDAPGGAPSIDVQAPLVAEIVQHVMSIIEDRKQRPSAEKIAGVVALAYEHATSAGKVDREFVQRLLRLV
jgi:hypothetical protein